MPFSKNDKNINRDGRVKGVQYQNKRIKIYAQFSVLGEH